MEENMSTVLESKGKPNLQVDISSATDVACNECNTKTFDIVFLIKKLSALVSPNGQETMVPVQVFKCSDCSHINEQFLPPE